MGIHGGLTSWSRLAWSAAVDRRWAWGAPRHAPLLRHLRAWNACCLDMHEGCTSRTRPAWGAPADSRWAWGAPRHAPLLHHLRAWSARCMDMHEELTPPSRLAWSAAVGRRWAWGAPRRAPLRHHLRAWSARCIARPSLECSRRHRLMRLGCVGATFAAVRRFAPATARVEGGDGHVLPGTPDPRAVALPELPLHRRASLRSRYSAGRGRRRTRLTSASFCGCPTPRERIPTLYGQSAVLSTLQPAAAGPVLTPGACRGSGQSWV